jgi:hypothetical protein
MTALTSADRMKWDPRKTSLLLKIAALQTLVVKVSSESGPRTWPRYGISVADRAQQCASAIGVLVSWGLTERQYHGPVSIGWSVIVWTLSVGLLATQL